MYQREKLFSKLGFFSYQSFSKATKLCRTFRHEYVELEHWIKVLIEDTRGDIPLLLNHYQVDLQKLNTQLDKILFAMPNRTTGAQDLSHRLELAVERGLLMSQVIDDVASVRTAHIFLGILQDGDLQRWLYRLSDEFKKIPLPQIMEVFGELVQNSVEQEDASLTVNTIVESEGKESGEILTRWCSDLTQQAQQGDIDPVIGRDVELRQLIDILLRRRQNNPILVGEAGVGKTAVVEALACKLASGKVPPVLQGARLLSLDLGRMQAGASVRGEFESRLKSLIDAITASVSPVILFCDEAHTLVGAGGQAGTGDAVNLLKPMLARGALRMIAATTWSEYKQFIEPDAALTRRFQSVLIGEPDEENAINMLRAIAPRFAKHHGVIIRDAAIHAAVRLTLRNLPARQLPDKAISLLDTACARVALSQHVPPQRIDLLAASVNVQKIEIEALENEIPLGEKGISEQLEALKSNISSNEFELNVLSQRSSQEQQLIETLKCVDKSDISLLQEKIEDLAILQNNDPLVHAWVDEHVVAEVLSDWTGIPSGRMIQDDIDNALNLEKILGERVFGQTTAINEIAQAVRISRAGIQQPERPLGVYLLAGPTGTGKTETAISLAEAMYAGAHNLIVFNMSEFQESHTVSTLKGAPPGYVGYGKGGKLTEAVRRKPYSVILLDEFDKAHPDVHDMFYQVFDKGWMEDGEGRIISFRQCFILITCNQGAEEIESAVSQDPSVSLAALRPIVYDALQRKFAPALLARMTIIPYLPLTIEAIINITHKQLQGLKSRLKNEISSEFIYSEEVVNWIANRVSFHPQSGRAVEAMVRQTILPGIGNEILKRKKQNDETKTIHLLIEDEKINIEFN